MKQKEIRLLISPSPFSPPNKIPHDICQRQIASHALDTGAGSVGVVPQRRVPKSTAPGRAKGPWHCEGLHTMDSVPELWAFSWQLASFWSWKGLVSFGLIVLAAVFFMSKTLSKQKKTRQVIYIYIRYTDHLRNHHQQTTSSCFDCFIFFFGGGEVFGSIKLGLFDKLFASWRLRCFL